MSSDFYLAFRCSICYSERLKFQTLEDFIKNPNPYSCDGSGCSQQKHPSNGWFLVIANHLTLEDLPEGILIVPWDDDVADRAGVKHFCGIPCVLKAVGQELVKVYQTGDVEQP